MTRSLALAALAALALAAPASAQQPFEPSPIQHVEVNGANLGYRTVGTGPPLVMIMGFSGTMADWDPALIADLATQHTVVVFDNRGMATSRPSPVHRLSIAQMADDTAGLIDALGFGKADVLGWSMGGNIAEVLAQRHPGKLNRLILAATDPGSQHAVLPKGPVLDVLDDPTASIPQLIKIIFPATPAGTKAGKAYVKRVGTWPGNGPDAYSTPNATVAGQIRAEGHAWYCTRCGAYAKLPDITAPTLVTDGAEDVVEPPVNSRIIARRIPGAKLTLYRGAGHAHLFQFNGRYAGEVNGFLAAP
jgi:pimeloyl-ACP methyl ester carboxylesterase